MRKTATTLLFLLLATALFSQTTPSFGGGPTVVSALVPQYCQGNSSTNNNRTPIWFWIELNGLNSNATYRYYTAMDSMNASPTSNGAGNPYLVNALSGTIRRSTNASMTNAAGYDSITADANGFYTGWFGVEPTGNGRFTPGTTLYPKLMLNNGAGGSSIAYRLTVLTNPVVVINYGTTASAALEGSAIYDSPVAVPQNFICLYDNVMPGGRPVSIAIVENDGMDLYAVTSIASFYRNLVDTVPMRWGTIVPNSLTNGVRSLEERDFFTGDPVDTAMDSDGIWCSGLNTVNMSNGNSGAHINSPFALSSSASIPDTVWINLSAGFMATTNDTNATITWDFGDTTTASGASVTHTYTSSGIVSVTVVISNGGCSDTIWHNVVVMLGTSTPRIIQLGYDIAPNPSTGMFNITAKSGIEKEIEVYDVLGNVVYTQTFTGTNTSADLTSLEKGVYFMRISENVQGGKTATKRIVIQ